jgi:divalent metal cation (Fe/Co/Zn/Cd) transporter
LALYVAFESSQALWMKEKAKESFIGMALALFSAIMMPILGVQKRKLGAALHSRALLADSTETLVCAALSVILLLGLGLNALWGWWWADPLAGLAIAAFLVKEGHEAWRGEGCGCK